MRQLIGVDDKTVIINIDVLHSLDVQHRSILVFLPSVMGINLRQVVL